MGPTSKKWGGYNKLWLQILIIRLTKLEKKWINATRSNVVFSCIGKVAVFRASKDKRYECAAQGLGLIVSYKKTSYNTITTGSYHKNQCFYRWSFFNTFTKALRQTLETIKEWKKAWGVSVRYFLSLSINLQDALLVKKRFDFSDIDKENEIVTPKHICNRWN